MPEYKAMGGGGFSHYPEHITDWVRRFLVGIEEMPAVGERECVVVADQGRASVTGLPGDFQWAHPVGKDDTRGERGIAVVPVDLAKRALVLPDRPVDVWVPIMPRRRSALQSR